MSLVLGIGTLRIALGMGSSSILRTLFLRGALAEYFEGVVFQLIL